MNIASLLVLTCGTLGAVLLVFVRPMVQWMQALKTLNIDLLDLRQCKNPYEMQHSRRRIDLPYALH
jgi:hypothetical protein